MSGVYVHIPFCAKKCFYCDFYTVQTLKDKNEFFDALFSEIKLRHNYLNNDILETIYIGGGTPSILKVTDIKKLLNEINKFHTVSENAEITIELNPDDLNEKFVEELRTSEVNRLSIGLQSFFDDDLKLMNRRHLATENTKAVKLLQDSGYTNISGDLIYGLPNLSLSKWERNLELFFALKIQHLSAYHITYESNTVFDNYLKKGKIEAISEKESEDQFKSLCSEAEKFEFIHYETSNFAKEGFFSKHNSSYWQQKKYLGLGPSAHSYNGKSRQFNINNLKNYIKGIKENKSVFEIEYLSLTDKYNDYLITKLRTVEGIDLNYIHGKFGTIYYENIIENLNDLQKNGYLKAENKRIIITKKGKFIEDTILEKLFYID